MSITAALTIAETLERRQYAAADRRALRTEATARSAVQARPATQPTPRRAWSRLRTRRLAHA